MPGLLYLLRQLLKKLFLSYSPFKKPNLKKFTASFVSYTLIFIVNSSAQSWLITGNAGTSPSTNFLGTTDNKPLVVRTNNVERLRIDKSGNVGIGINSPLQKLDVNGNINLRKGFSIYAENHPVLTVDSANGNTLLGNGAGPHISGSSCTAVGYQSLFSNTVSYNTGIGYRALYLNTSGINNTACGLQALYTNSTGNSSTALGINAPYSSTGNYNTAVGDYALFNTTTAWGNTAVGDIAGASYHNGYYNTFIGAEADATAADIYNSTALGRSTVVTAASQVRIGNSFVGSIGGYANWTNISDRRVKKNIKENVPGLKFINKLKPITYNLDLDAADRIVQSPVRKNAKIMGPSQLDITARQAKEQVVYTGFVAQDRESGQRNWL